MITKNEEMYLYAKEHYQKLGVDTDMAMSRLDSIPVSMNCWQGDDVSGFEVGRLSLSGGIQATGSYPGKARNIDDLCSDINKAVSLIPGKLKLNLHAIYGDFQNEKIDRDAISPKYYERWVEFAKACSMGLDFNPTLFSHEKSLEFTLSSPHKEIREFWIEHCKASRRVSEYFGKSLGEPSVNNIWIPDGYKDKPVDRFENRLILKKALDEIFTEKIDKKYNLDAVEGKLFGIGSESCVIGSNDFYLAYVSGKEDLLLTLDTGHFHPTELVSDKISSALIFMQEILLHVSRPVRWDSDHVVIFDEELKDIANEIIFNGFEKRVHIGLDFFDASINRIAAWVIGVRNMKKALLAAMLTPVDILKAYERSGDFTSRLALTEELKTFPISAVWDQYCLTRNVPVGYSWMDEVKSYENEVLSKR